MHRFSQGSSQQVEVLSAMTDNSKPRSLVTASSGYRSQPPSSVADQAKPIRRIKAAVARLAEDPYPPEALAAAIITGYELVVTGWCISSTMT